MHTYLLVISPHTPPPLQKKRDEKPRTEINNYSEIFLFPKRKLMIDRVDSVKKENSDRRWKKTSFCNWSWKLQN